MATKKESKQLQNAKKIRQYQRTEYARCLVDPLYFIKTYVKIQHQERGIIPFSLYPFQEETLTSFHDNDRCIVLKSRQMGISTLIASYALWGLLFHEGKNILVISTKETAAKEIIAKVKVAYDNLPAFLRIPCLESNKLSIKLNNQSKILATSSASDSARGFASALLLIDECLGYDSIIEIRNKKTGEIKNVKIGELFDSNEYK